MVCVVVSMAGGLSVAWFVAMVLYGGAAAVLLTAPDAGAEPTSAA
jgi:hypothetical protein